MTKYITYLRVSTQSQGRSGLGLEAQQVAVAARVRDGEVIAEFVEIESGRNDERPKLHEALKLAKKHKATLVIAKLDRLARDVHFISGLMKSGVEFAACDLPMANKLSIHIMAAIAEHEAEMISQRTKVALRLARPVASASAAPSGMSASRRGVRRGLRLRLSARITSSRSSSRSRQRASPRSWASLTRSMHGASRRPVAANGAPSRFPHA